MMKNAKLSILQSSADSGVRIKALNYHLFKFIKNALQKRLLHHNFVVSARNLKVKVIDNKIKNGPIIYEKARINLIVVFTIRDLRVEFDKRWNVEVFTV
jgi:hypothetical protein